jgi:hypothetical protein
MYKRKMTFCIEATGMLIGGAGRVVQGGWTGIVFPLSGVMMLVPYFGP